MYIHIDVYIYIYIDICKPRTLTFSAEAGGGQCAPEPGCPGVCFRGRGDGVRHARLQDGASSLSLSVSLSSSLSPALSLSPFLPLSLPLSLSLSLYIYIYIYIYISFSLSQPSRMWRRCAGRAPPRR